MNNRIVYFILLLLMMTAYAPSALKAADISVGATTWYSKWETPDSWGFDFNDPAFLYGPVLSFKFNEDYNFTFVFLYGQFEHTIKSDDGLGGTFETDIKADRYDSDAALNYRLNNYLKLFAGVKYMGYNYKIIYDSALGLDSYNADHKGFGPGGGLSAVFPIWDDFYILANISGMYLWGSQGGDDTTTDDYIEYGINTGASLAYYISAASTTISLGGRYQAYTTDADYDCATKEKNKFYGATLTATYSFSI